jgi:ABC-type branched-subunit amino acid transport system substrate-binding protein
MYAQSQITIPMAQWAAKNGIKRVVTLVSDYSSGLDAEKAFIDEFKADGGEIVEAVRAPPVSVSKTRLRYAICVRTRNVALSSCASVTLTTL